MITILLRIAATLLSVSYSHVVAQTSSTAPLTLAIAVQLAVSQSRLVEAGRLQASSARDMALAAGQLPDPVLKLGINNLPVSGDDRFSFGRDFMTMRSVGVMQEFIRADKRLARTLRFEKEAQSAEATRFLNTSNIQRSTALAWLDRHFQERMAGLLVQLENEARLQIDAAEDAYRGNRGSRGDIIAARSALAQIEDRAAVAGRQVQTAKTLLIRWVGEVAEQPLSAPPALNVAPLSEVDLESQIQHHPQIAVMVKQEEIALADADLARANQRADWSAELMYSQRGSAYSNMISINLSLPLQWGQKDRQERELAAKQATILQLRAEREDALSARTAEIRAMLQEWHSHRARLKRYDQALTPLALERTQAAITSYRAGSTSGGNLNAVLEARRAELETGMERLRIETESARLWVQLTYLTPFGEQP